MTVAVEVRNILFLTIWEWYLNVGNVACVMRCFTKLIMYKSLAEMRNTAQIYFVANVRPRCYGELFCACTKIAPPRVNDSIVSMTV